MRRRSPFHDCSNNAEHESDYKPSTHPHKSISLTHQTGMLRPCECLLLLRTSLSFSPAPLLSAHHNVVSRIVGKRWQPFLGKPTATSAFVAAGKTRTEGARETSGRQGPRCSQDGPLSCQTVSTVLSRQVMSASGTLQTLMPMRRMSALRGEADIPDACSNVL